MSRRRSASELFQVRPGFLRSVDVAADYDDPGSSRHYVTTKQIEETIQRIVAGLKQMSSQRAWRITGDFGTGKSSFALVLARVAGSETRRLPQRLRRWAQGKKAKLEPVLATCDYEPLSKSILRAVQVTELRVFGNSKCPSAVRSADELSKVFSELIGRLRAEGRCDGLLLVLDELGQGLRYAAQHPDEDDVFVLQRLGEMAVRSKEEPLMVVALLHQGFASYAAAAETTVRKEWDKVAGRYEEVVFAQPMEHTAVLLTETLGIKRSRIPQSVRSRMRAAMRASLACGVYGALAAEKSLLDLASRFYPMNPAVLPVLVALLRKFGQNERSLVSFLTSFEPHGLRAFASEEPVGGRLYRISDLYDYFGANMSSISSGPQKAQWEIASSIVDRGAQFGHTAEKLLKAVALINTIDDPGLAATREYLLISENDGDAEETLQKQESEWGLLHERGASRGFSLWPHTSADLGDLLGQADAVLGEVSPTAVIDYLPQRRLVARRHYIETGNLRHFTVQYTTYTQAPKLFQMEVDDPGADGRIVVIVTFSAEERKLAERLPEVCEASASTVCGVSAPVAGVTHIIGELRRREWVRSHAKELSFDRFANEFLRSEIEQLREALRVELGSIVTLAVDRDRPIRWFHNGEFVKVKKHRGIAGYLSTVCDEFFPCCPIVRNELINRRITSSAASRARTLLIEAIANRSSEERLGLDGNLNPPELAVYLSVLKAGKLHILDGESWRFLTFEEMSDDPCRIGPTLRKIYGLLVEKELGRVSVDRIYEELRRPPYGVKDGLLPLLISVFLAGHWQETSIYEDGTFVLEMDSDVFQRLNKEPEAFELQHCSISGVRLEVYRELARVLGGEVGARVDILTVIRPLVSFAVSLPEYVRRCRSLSREAKGILDLLLESREPATLLFKELPTALGLPAVTTDGFEHEQVADLVRELTEKTAELRNAYPTLLKRIGDAILASFDWEGSIVGFRKLISERAMAVKDQIVDLELKAFANRIGDLTLQDTKWVESVAALAGQKAAERWGESDETRFFEQLAGHSARFRRVESMVFGGSNGRYNGGRCVRFTVTRPTGEEVEEVVYWGESEERGLSKASEAIQEVINEYGPITMAAAAEILFAQKTCPADPNPKEAQ